MDGATLHTLHALRLKVYKTEFCICLILMLFLSEKKIPYQFFLPMFEAYKIVKNFNFSLVQYHTRRENGDGVAAT